MARGHVIEWHFDIEPAFKNHFSRRDGCMAYRMYLKERITRDVVSHARPSRTCYGALALALAQR